MASIDGDITAVEQMYSRMESLLDKPEEVLRQRTAVSNWSIAD